MTGYFRLMARKERNSLAIQTHYRIKINLFGNLFRIGPERTDSHVKIFSAATSKTIEGLKFPHFLSLNQRGPSPTGLKLNFLSDFRPDCNFDSLQQAFFA